MGVLCFFTLQAEADAARFGDARRHYAANTYIDPTSRAVWGTTPLCDTCCSFGACMFWQTLTTQKHLILVVANF